MDAMTSGGTVGVTLALLNFMCSTFISSRVLRASKVSSIVLALGGFVARLGILSVLFYGVYRIRIIHFQTTLIAFVCCFTLCLMVKAVCFQRQVHGTNKKRIER